MENTKTYEERKRENLEVLKHFLATDKLFEKNFIDKEEWKVRKLKEKDLSLEVKDLSVFCNYIGKAFGMELDEFVKIKNSSNKNENYDEILTVSALKHNALATQIGKLPEAKGGFKLEWDKINMTKPEHLFVLIMRIPFESVQVQSKNLNSNHVFEELRNCRLFLDWLLNAFPNFKDSDLFWFREFRKNLEKLSWKLFKKCYYYNNSNLSEKIEKNKGNKNKKTPWIKPKKKII